MGVVGCRSGVDIERCLVSLLNIHPRLYNMRRIRRAQHSPRILRTRFDRGTFVLVSCMHVIAYCTMTTVGCMDAAEIAMEFVLVPLQALLNLAGLHSRHCMYSHYKICFRKIAYMSFIACMSHNTVLSEHSSNFAILHTAISNQWQ